MYLLITNIIDSDDQGLETVHFTNMVDEKDLLSLMDEDQVKEYMTTKGYKEEEPTPVVEEPKEEAEPVEEPVESEPEKKNPACVLALVLLLGIGGAGGYMYLTRSKSKKTEEVIDDPDADYNEDEDDYLSSLPDDPEDFDSEIETEDDIPIEDTDKVVNKQTKDKNDSPPSLIHLIPRYKKVTTFN